MGPVSLLVSSGASYTTQGLSRVGLYLATALACWNGLIVFAGVRRLC